MSLDVAVGGLAVVRSLELAQPAFEDRIARAVRRVGAGIHGRRVIRRHEGVAAAIATAVDSTGSFRRAFPRRRRTSSLLFPFLAIFFVGIRQNDDVFGIVFFVVFFVVVFVVDARGRFLSMVIVSFRGRKSNVFIISFVILIVVVVFVGRPWFCLLFIVLIGQKIDGMRHDCSFSRESDRGQHRARVFGHEAGDLFQRRNFLGR